MPRQPHRQLRWAVLADDITGACDAGAQFSQRGSFSVLRLDDSLTEANEAEVAVLSSNSRNDPAEVVGEKVAALSRQLRQENRGLIFLKIDSTLRGNLGAGIRAAMTAWETSLAVVAPAFPAMGRILQEGWLRGAGCSTLPAVHLPTLLREQGVARVVHIDRSVFQRGIPHLRKQIQRFAYDGPQVVVVDAVIQEHLLLLAQAVVGLEPRALMVGSAGLGAEVAAHLAAAHGRKNQMLSWASKTASEARPAVVAIGSRNPVTGSQVDYLASHRVATCWALRECSGSIIQDTAKKGLHLAVTIDFGEDEGFPGKGEGDAAMKTRIIDLSHPLEPTTPVYPGDPPVKIQVLESTRYTRPDGQRTLNSSRISIGNHCGTHLDAPYHLFEEGRTVDQMNLDHCAGPTLLIRLRDIAENGEIDAPHFYPYHERLHELGKVVLETGWSRRWGKPEYFTHHPVLTPTAAEFLIASRTHLVGIDVPSVDRPPFPVHAALLRHDIVILENLTNLSALASEVFELVAVPLRITGRDGSPVRAIAWEVS